MALFYPDKRKLYLFLQETSDLKVPVVREISQRVQSVKCILRGGKKFLITTNTSEPWADGRIETALQSLTFRSHAAGAKNAGLLAMLQI